MAKKSKTKKARTKKAPSKRTRTQITRSAKGVSVLVSGEATSGLSADRVKEAIEHNIACNLTNRCRDKNQTALDRVRCVEARARRRVEGVNFQLSPRARLKVDVQALADGFEIHVTGDNAAKLARTYTDRELGARLQDAVACARRNRCGARDQSSRDQLNCINVGAKRRLALN